MRKSLWAAAGVGAAYLLRNKDSRQKLMQQFQTVKDKYLSSMNTGNANSDTTNPSTTSTSAVSANQDNTRLVRSTPGL